MYKLLIVTENPTKNSITSVIAEYPSQDAAHLAAKAIELQNPYIIGQQLRISIIALYK